MEALTFKEFIEACNKLLLERPETADYRVINIYDYHYRSNVYDPPFVCKCTDHGYSCEFVEESELSSYVPKENEVSEMVIVIDRVW